MFVSFFLITVLVVAMMVDKAAATLLLISSIDVSLAAISLIRELIVAISFNEDNAVVLCEDTNASMTFLLVVILSRLVSLEIELTTEIICVLTV